MAGWEKGVNQKQRENVKSIQIFKNLTGASATLHPDFTQLASSV